MKYGICFLVISVLLLMTAFQNGEWFCLLIWPALSFAIVGFGFVSIGPRVFGKSLQGIIRPIHLVFLLPYFVFLWLVWYAVRLFSSEGAIDQLTEDIIIGRRLLSHELPQEVEHVIDLTCEFTEPKGLRARSFYSFQILDGSAPRSDELQKWVAQIAGLRGRIYIHCAEGHGRTGLFAAALLVYRGDFESWEDALQHVKSMRPRVSLSRSQIEALQTFATNLKKRPSSGSLTQKKTSPQPP